jgi:predicted small secreted protein
MPPTSVNTLSRLTLMSGLRITCIHEWIINMRTFSIALALFVLIGAIPLLGACHTTAGAGEDLSATGHVITHSADKNTP